MEIQFRLADQILHGLDEIALYLRVSRRTAWRWIHEIALPAMQTPAGTWITSIRLIDQWILATNRAQMEAKRKERHFKDLIERTQ